MNKKENTLHILYDIYNSIYHIVIKNLYHETLSNDENNVMNFMLKNKDNLIITPDLILICGEDDEK